MDIKKYLKDNLPKEVEYNGKPCDQCNCIEVTESKSGGQVKGFPCLSGKLEEYIKPLIN